MALGSPQRVAIVTGAGRGLGRAHALEVARRGVAVVVNDVGGAPDGEGSDDTPAAQVVAEIESHGGRAIVSSHDVADWEAAAALVAAAVEHFGRLDILVNNAGILRDRTIAKMEAADWDAVIRVHLRGTFAPTHFATLHWRERARRAGPIDGRLINTSSGSGLYGNFGQSNYAAAKAGIAAFTIVAAKELAALGVTANVVAPGARTRLTEALLDASGSGDDLAPEHVARVVAWIASPAASHVSGRVFDVVGTRIGIAEGWHLGERLTHDGPWTDEELEIAIPKLVAAAQPLADQFGERHATP